VRDLKVHFPVRGGGLFGRSSGAIKAVDGVSLEVRRGETLGLVGESGSGKTTLGRAILQLHRPTAGTVEFDGRELTRLAGESLRLLRQRMQMIFQDPYASLNPRMTIGGIVGEPLEFFGLAARRERIARVRELLSTVGLNPAFVTRYPHQFSGGQRQRIGIARALAPGPELVICDEPISALDVSIRAQILNLLQDLQARLGLTYLFVAHDLSVVRHVSDRVAVMYLGRIVELADRDDLYRHALHPYTRALISAVPIPDPRAEQRREVTVLRGEIPSPLNPPAGCHFHTRCPIARPVCRQLSPPLIDVAGGHQVACHAVGGPGAAEYQASAELAPTA
jgi:oligopeptide transport system ATP-binding protein